MADVDMESISLECAMILARPNRPDVPVRVVAHPDRDRRYRHYRFAAGACSSVAWRKFSPERRLLQLFVEWPVLLVKLGVDPADLHRALLVIPEYRGCLPVDFHGATRLDDNGDERLVCECCQESPALLVMEA